LPEFDKRPTKQKRQVYGGSRVIVRRKENAFVAILRGLFPWKGDARGDVVRKLVFLTALCVLIVSSFIIIYFYFIKDIATDNINNSFKEHIDNYTGADRVTIRIQDDPAAPPGTTGREVEVLGEYVDFYEENNDFVGFLNLYPWIQHGVYQAEDNDYYLKRNHLKVPTTNGTIFADAFGRFTPTERPHNTIIYGHNLLTQNGFQPLSNYRYNKHGDSFQFLKDHPIIEFNTLYERGTYKIFAIFQSNVWETHGEIFDYWNYIYFKSKSHFDYFVAECLDRSLFYTNVDMQYGDEILMLSTCDFEMFVVGQTTAIRLVVAARRVRDDELPRFTQGELDAFIDNRGSDADGFLKRRMFEAYYDARRSKGWGGRNWDLNYIRDFKG